MVYIPDADALQYAEGHTSGRDIASARRSGVVVERGTHTSALRGNREISRRIVTSFDLVPHPGSALRV